MAAACSGKPDQSVEPEKFSSADASSQKPSPVANSKPTKAAPRGLPANALRMQMVQIMDRNGFEQPIPASFGLIPVGWKAQGGVQWGQQFTCTNGYNVNWAATSPDGTQTLAVLPQEKWETNNYGAGPSTPGCASAPYSSSQQYLTQLVARLRPGASVSRYAPRPDLAAKLAHLNSSTPSAMGEMRTWVEAGQVEFTYDESGQPMSGASGNLAKSFAARKLMTILMPPAAGQNCPATTTTPGVSTTALTSFPMTRASSRGGI